MPNDTDMRLYFTHVSTASHEDHSIPRLAKDRVPPKVLTHAHAGSLAHSKAPSPIANGVAVCELLVEIFELSFRDEHNPRMVRVDERKEHTQGSDKHPAYLLGHHAKTLDHSFVQRKYSQNLFHFAF